MYCCKNCFDHVLGILNRNPYIFQVIGMLSIVSLMAPPFQKVCETCHVVDIILIEKESEQDDSRFFLLTKW